jgi:hypothetical protein
MQALTRRPSRWTVHLQAKDDVDIDIDRVDHPGHERGHDLGKRQSGRGSSLNVCRHPTRRDADAELP